MASLLLNLAQLRKDDHKFSIANTINTDNTNNRDYTNNKFETWFWNKNTNEIDSNTEEERNSKHDHDLEKDESKIEKAASSEIQKVEIKMKRKKEEKLCGGYRKGSRRTQIRKQKSVWELEKKAFKSYNIWAL